jgi:succinyl-CoA synthetase alpha subunit
MRIPLRGGRGTHEGKVKRLKEVGAFVVEDFNEIPNVTTEVLKNR